MKRGILTGIILFCTGIAWAQNPCDSLPVVSINATDTVTCLGGEITLTATGGVSYQWDNGIVNSTPFTPAVTQEYQVTVTDALGCVGTDSITVEVLPLPTIEANSSSLSICNGDSVLLEATGAVSYDWITPNIENSSYYTPSALGANTFIVEGTGANGCTNNSQVIVVVHAIPQQPSLNTGEIATCLEVAFDGNLEGTTNNGRVIWFADEELTTMITDQPELPLSNNEVGITSYWASSFENGCYSPGVEAMVEVYPLPIVDAGDDVTTEAGTRGELIATANVPVSVTWSPEVNLEDPNSLSTRYTALETATYNVAVVDDNNCTSSDEVTLTVKSNLIISNIMTPDGNGENDTWKLYPEVVLQTCEVKLFDGFGRELINTDDYQNNWDGMHEGEAVPDGDYYYYVNCSGGFSKKGTLTILR
jgi:gliding motility-associated-like protein